MNRGSSTRSSSGRVPLGSRGNVTNIENGNAKAKTKSGLGTILPSKKDSRPVSFAAAVPVPTAPTTFNRQSSTTTTASMASESTGGGGVSAASMGGGENNRAFDSLSSDTLRQVIGTTVGKQPLGGSSMMNQPNQQQVVHSNNNNNKDVPSGVVKPSSTATVISSLTTTTSSSSSEPITIIEHRKRPCGNGHTVHTYLRGKLIGKGGFAKVYKVTSLDTNKEYAVKVVPKANLVKSRARQKVSNMCILFLVCCFIFCHGLCTHLRFLSPLIYTYSSYNNNNNSYKQKSRSIEQ